MAGALTAVMAASTLTPVSAFAMPTAENVNAAEENVYAAEESVYAAEDQEAIEASLAAGQESHTNYADEEQEAVAADLYGDSPVFTSADIAGVQATTLPNFYGQRLYSIEITFKDRTDMTGAARPESYGVWDRDMADGKFVRGLAEKVVVSGNKAVLYFDQGPAATGDYTADPFGMLCTT
jgi:hypothetical protein